jgi:2,3-bisphosphoglycerate-independent phosphoglycerate mutase
VDAHLARVVEAASASNYVTLITADHGNLETLWNEDGTPHVAHTSNPVACLLVDPLRQAPLHLCDGKLADVAPTILSALGVDQPAGMDGACLVSGEPWGGKRKVLLVILDGWGIGAPDDTNPIYTAFTPTWDALLQRHPSSHLQASGEAVGLQAGKAGNSEAGHLNLGAGRVVLQDDVRLDLALKDGSFYTNETFQSVMQEVTSRKSSLHLIALLSEKSSHGSIAYPLALLKMAKARRVAQVYIHLIFDGRSTEPGTAPALLEKLEAEMQTIGLGQIVSGIGRGIALDRDGNYGKIQRTYEMLVNGQGRKVSAAV